MKTQRKNDLHPSKWIKVTEKGLLCVPADVYIDPLEPVRYAIITHGHADHARAGHQVVYATAATLDIMQVRYGADMANKTQGMPYREKRQLGNASDPVFITLFPAGHILGSSQVLLEYRGSRVVVSGDYKRNADPSCEAFEAVPCDVFITEATFGLPVFDHPPIHQEIEKLLQSLHTFSQHCHLVGCYALGKCQRVIMALRALGYNKPVYLHGAHINLCQLYEKHGFDLGKWIAVSEVADKTQLAGEIVLAPPSALTDRWSRRLPNVKIAMASGWMQIRARSKQKRVELPLVISDHSDWHELIQTIHEVNPEEVWVTHGREEALVYQAQKMGFKAKALSMVEYDTSGEND